MSVYSNCYHELNTSLVKEMKSNPGQEEQHAAYNFCGHIKWNGTEWENDVWQYHESVKIIKGEEIEDVIEAANADFGYE